MINPVTALVLLYWIANSAFNDCIWTKKTSPPLPREDAIGAIAAYNDTIYLIGGALYPYQLVKFSISTKEFIDQGAYSMPYNITNTLGSVQVEYSGQFWTQIEETIYWIDYISNPQDIVSYNLITKAYVKFDTNNIVLGQPFEGRETACIASTTSYLFVVGGYTDQLMQLNTLKIYNFLSEQWYPGPRMQTARDGLSCIVHPVNNALYAIAGLNHLDLNLELSSVEKIEIDNIMNSDWHYLKNELPKGLKQPKSVVYDNLIVIFGPAVSMTYAYYPSKDVFIIHTITDIITSGSDLAYAVEFYAAISVYNVIYVFGGRDENQNYLNSWQYCKVPTQAPSVSPSVSPIIIETTAAPIEESTPSPTILISSNSNALIQETWFLALVIGSVVFCTVSALFCLYRRKSKSTKNDQLKHTMLIRNPMVILLGIGHYDEEPKNPDPTLMNAYFSNLDVELDVKNLLGLFSDKLNYRIYPQYDQYPKIHWTQNELITVLKKYAAIFATNVISNEENVDDNKMKFDGLIIAISCHGIKDQLVTSDFNLINKNVIHRMFSSYFPGSRNVPRIIIYDACDGLEQRKSIQKRKKSHVENANTVLHDKAKGYSINDIKPPVELIRSVSKDINLWNSDAHNPDHKLAIINASNLGFQSRMNSEDGSYLIHKFVNKTMTALEKDTKKQPFLSEIMSEIQQELGEKTQLPTFTFNNDTGFIKFIINTTNQKVEHVEHEEKKEIEEIIETNIDDNELKREVIEEIKDNDNECKDSTNTQKHDAQISIEMGIVKDNEYVKKEDQSSNKWKSSSLSALQRFKQINNDNADKIEHLLSDPDSISYNKSFSTKL